MKLTDKLLPFAALAVVLGLVAFWLMPGGVNAAPAATFRTLDGRTLTTADLKGKPAIVTFWATSCPGCMEEMPHLIELYRELQPKGLQIVGVAMSYDPPNNVLELVRQKQVPYPIALDTDEAIARAFGTIRVTPTSFLIAPDGRIVQQKIGAFDLPALKTQLKSMLGA